MRFAVVVIVGAVACAGRQRHVPKPEPEPAPIVELASADELAQLTAPTDIERALTAVINQRRAAAERPLLRTDLQVAASARHQAERMRDEKAIGIRSPETPADRLRAAGLMPVSLHESGIEVDSAAGAADALASDPQLRANLESATATHVGIGVALDDQAHRLFVTITYVEFPPRIDAAAAAEHIGHAISGAAHCAIDKRLTGVAQRYAERMAAGGERTAVWPEVKHDLEDAAGRRFAKVANAVASVVDVEHVDISDLIHDRAADDIGIGVAQSERHGLQGGVTWVVVFLAQRLTPRNSISYH
jgi:uncharacterized protein YkwD